MDLFDAIFAINKTHEEDELAPLMTVWGEKVQQGDGTVLQEHPTPQCCRESFVILNGWWDYAITDSAEYNGQFDGRILVPFSPESILSGVQRQLQPEEYLWYERILDMDSVELQCPYREGRCFLHFGAVDQICAIYVNRKKVISHLGGYLPFEVDITDYLTVGENILTVVAQDDTDTSFHSRGKQTLKRGGMFYTGQSGIWQTVWLEWRPKEYIRSFRLTPDFDKNRLFVRVETSDDMVVSVQAFAGEEPDAKSSAHCEAGRPITLVLELESHHTWSPKNPFLYDLELIAGEDVVKSYFGMRSFTIEPDKRGTMRFFLNHKPYFLFGVLDQGYWPDGLYTAPSDEALIYDIMTMKKMGYRMMRKHMKIESARWYYHCDRLGMIVWQDMVSGGTSYSKPLVSYLPTVFPGTFSELRDNKYHLFARQDPASRKEWIRECKETVETLYNSTSISTWVPFNEGWGQFDAMDAVDKIRQIDKTRTIDHASGWFDQGGGDFKSVHNYFRKLEVRKDPRAFVISEFGGFACYMKGHSSVDRIYGYRKYHSVGELQTAYDNLIKGEVIPLIKKGLSGCCYTQVSDVEEEVNGIMTYDRRIQKIR